MPDINWQQLVVYLLGLAAIAGMVWTMISRLQDDIRDVKKLLLDYPKWQEKVTNLEKRADSQSRWRDGHEQEHREMAVEAAKRDVTR